MEDLGKLLKIKESGAGVSAFAEIPSDENLGVDLVDEIIKDIEGNVGIDEATDCSYALTEAMNNAIYHGNLGLRDIRGGKEREKKIADSELRNKKIALSYFRTAGYLVFSVTDEGEGFDYEKYFEGMGAQMIKATMDEICFNDKGNSITMVKYFDKI